MKGILEGFAPSLLAFLVQGSLVALVALVAGRLSARKGPAVRIAIYRAGLLSILGLLVAGPALQTFVHPWWAISPPPVPAPLPAVVAEPMRTAPAVSYVTPTELPEPTVDTSFPPATAPPPSLAQLAVGAWGLGVLLLIAAVAGGAGWVQRLGTRNRFTRFSRVGEISEGICARHGMDSARIVVSASVGSPFVAGVPTPTIFLPESIETEFDSDQMEAILCHELAHIRNGDCFWAFLSKVACAVAWPNPFVWLLTRQMTLASEDLCDQLVIGAGIKPSIYARCLLRVAETLACGPRERLAGASVFPARSELSRRISIMLNKPSFSMTAVSRRARAQIGVLAAVTALTGCVLVSARGSRAPSTPAVKQEAAAAPATVTPPTPSLDIQKLDEAEWKLKWADGAPVVDTDVRREIAFRGSVYIDASTTGKDGTVRFKSRKRQMPDQPLRGVLLVVATPKTVTYKLVTNGHYGGEVRLAPTAPVSVKFVTNTGEPASGLKVEPMYLSLPGDQPNCDLYAYRNEITATSNSDGLCTLPEMPSGLALRIEHEDPRFAAFPWNQTFETGKPGQLMTLEPGASIFGRLVDPEGKPAVKVPIYAYRTGTPDNHAVYTDADGNYSLTCLLPGEYSVNPMLPYGQKTDLVGDSRGGLVVRGGDKMTNVNLSLIHGGRLVGTVTYANTGRPASEVQVSAMSETGPNGGNGLTDKAGHYDMLVPPGTYLVNAVPKGAHVIDPDRTQRFQVKSGATVEVEKTLPVEPFEAPLHGRVVDAQGASVVGATVTVPDEIGFATAVSGADGRFRLGRIVPAPARVRAYKGADCVTQPLLVTQDGDLVLKLAPNTLSSMAGRVIDEEGQPMADAHVSIFETGSHATAILQAQTDNEGRYHLDQVWPNASYVVFADRKGYEGGSIQQVPIGQGEHKALADLRLPRQDTFLSGRVVDDQGEPVAGAKVTLQIQGTETATASDGSFRIEKVARRKYNLLATKADRMTVKEVTGGKADLLIVLAAPPRVITQPPPQVDKVGSLIGKRAPRLLVGDWANTPPIDITHTKAKAVVLNFWGGGCPSCVVELPTVEQYADQVSSHGVLLLGIHDSTSTTPEVKKFLADHKVHFPVAVDTKDRIGGWGFGKTFQAFKVAASPAFVVIRKGTVVCATHSLDEMMAFVNKL